ncbi:hypothetical protein LAZ67_5003175 [Cordylochernes scorpioides]|uniref:CCHC-type domain-containing protein n=1 Tax=Cordylochernes scorpioides TaxID=51811 RepID=A0ABY6KH40_9ARAC|nr:hypothetical protein LAZ67_5003175 [Cordylochernes scorpioides]
MFETAKEEFRVLTNEDMTSINRVNYKNNFQAANESTVKGPKAHNVYHQKGSTSKVSAPNLEECYRCGLTTHPPYKCGARNMKCTFCNKLGHLNRVCRNKNEYKNIGGKKRNIQNISENNEDSDEYTFFLGSDNKENIYIDGKEITMTIDTGSDTTFIGLENLKNIFPKSQMPTLNGTERKFYAYGQTSPLPCCGYFFADVSWGERSIKEQIFVIEGKAEPLLGKKASFELEIIKRGTKIRNIQQEVIPKDIYNLIQENMNLFQGQGNVKGYSQKITLKENVTPVAQRCRHFPYKMVEAINQELDKMIEDGIIEEVHEASEWISNIVAVPKKGTEEIRLCVDLKEVMEHNQAYKERMKKYADSKNKALPHDFKKGNIVYVANTEMKSKLTPNYDNQRFIILETISPNSFKLVNTETGSFIIRNAKHLRHANVLQDFNKGIDLNTTLIKTPEIRMELPSTSRYLPEQEATLEDIVPEEQIAISDMDCLYPNESPNENENKTVITRSGRQIHKRIKVEDTAKPQPGATIGRDARSDPVVLNRNIDIPKYDGTEDPRRTLEEIGFLYHWADYVISRYAAMNMIGSAKTWLNLHKISFTSWENFKSRLIEDFASDANKEEMKTRLNRMQQWNESAIRFEEDILVLCNKVDPQMEEEIKINWVIGENRTEDGRPICFKCNKPGHVARYCRVRFVRIVEEDPIVTQDKVEEEIRMDKGTEKSRPLLYADVNNSTHSRRSNLAKHRIDTEGAKPIKHKSYRVSAIEREIIKDQIDEMLRDGMIRPSSSPWSFPVILVKKRDGHFNPNATTYIHTDASNINLGATLVQKFGDKEKTGQTREKRRYPLDGQTREKPRYPLDGTNQREAKTGQTREKPRYPLDGQTREKPRYPLDGTNQREAKVSSRRTNQREAKVSSRRDKPERSQAARVQEPSEWYKITTQLKLSTNKEEEPQQPSTSTSTPVKKFNSNSSKAHQYQPFPRTAAATHHQQEPHKPINLPPYPCKICASHQLPNQFHFHRDCPLKNNNHPKRINPDASSLGVAGVLKQPDEQGILHPIGYFSRKLHPYEQNYTASEIETLAIINSVQRFHTYLHNIHFTLHTDHLPLKWIKNVKNPQETNAKVERLNSTIINRLRCEYNDNLKIPWTKYIPKITESYNETVHTTTGFTPKFLYYGIQPQYIEHDTVTHTPIEKARKLAIERTIKSHEHSKQLYDIKHPEPIFKEGDQEGHILDMDNEEQISAPILKPSQIT